MQPVQDCKGLPCPDGGGAGGSAAAGGGASAGGAAGGSMAGGEAGGTTAGGDAGGAAAGGATAGGATAGGATAGGATAGGAMGMGGGATAGGSSGDGGTSDACSEYARRQCDFFIRCTTTNQDGFFGTNNQVPSSQRTACEAFQGAKCDKQQAGRNRGRASVNVAAYRTCLDAIFPSASCQRDFNLALSACDESAYTTGLAAPGTVCTRDVECANGFCDIDPFSFSECGTCRAFRNPDGGALGQCSRDGECSPGSSCQFVGRQGMCALRAGLDAGCTSTPTCAQGLICPDPQAAQRFCQVGKPEGAPCVMGRLECDRSGADFELMCAGSRCVKRFNTTAGGACNNAETIGDAGAPTWPACLDSEYCSLGICTSRRPVGQPCQGTNDICAHGSRCVNSICTAFADLNGACTATPTAALGGCKDLLSCANRTTCQPQFVITGACTSIGGVSEVTPRCVGPTYCPLAVGGIVAMCVPTKPNGQTCRNSFECVGGLCQGGMCANECYR
ncbi:MAG: hypothetical protein Q8S33_01055 [Myxococcales bacterium]|nr:hypothetical protein [Myxococcales bacterium]